MPPKGAPSIILPQGDPPGHIASKNLFVRLVEQTLGRGALASSTSTAHSNGVLLKQSAAFEDQARTFGELQDFKIR